MTLPYERNYAITNTRDFLRDLLDPKATPRIPRAIRQRAYRCLKHFPSDYDIYLTADGRVFEKIKETK